MSYSLIQEDGVTRIVANLALSNGESIYAEVPLQPSDAEADYEQILIDRTLAQLKQYDAEGNEIALGFTVTSVTQP
jgi:hypothetical protein